MGSWQPETLGRGSYPVRTAILLTVQRPQGGAVEKRGAGGEKGTLAEPDRPGNKAGGKARRLLADIRSQRVIEPGQRSYQGKWRPGKMPVAAHTGQRG